MKKKTEVLTVFEVYFTYDLDQFKNMHGNRDIQSAHVAKLRLSMEKHGMLINPVIVNHKMEIIDGQHRIEASKLCSKGIYYIQIPRSFNYGIDHVQLYNINTRNWKVQDYVHLHATSGNEHYIKLQKFQKKFPNFGIALLAQMISQKKMSPGAVSQGKLLVGDEDLAVEWAYKLLRVKTYFMGFNSRGFASTMMTLFRMELFDFERFMKKLALPGSPMLQNLTNQDKYLDLIDDIYNYRTKKENKISFKYAS